MELTEIESKYFDFVEGKISSDEFERWVYRSQVLEKELSADLYLQLISLDFGATSAKYEIEKIFDCNVDHGKIETIRLLGHLQSIIERDKDEAASLVRMYDLYCDGYDFLDDLGLGIGLEIEVPPAEYGVDYFSDLSPTQKAELIDNYYPEAKELALEVKSWIVNGDLKLTGKSDKLFNRWEYVDNRSAKDRVSRVWRDEDGKFVEQ